MKSLPAKLTTRLRVRVWVVGFAFLLTAQSGAQACATCMGGDDQQLVEASNTVLWSLLSLVGFIFVATGCTVWYLWRRATMPQKSEVRFVDCLAPQPANNGQ